MKKNIFELYMLGHMTNEKVLFLRLQCLSSAIADSRE
jgi:hypothetical protein